MLNFCKVKYPSEKETLKTLGKRIIYLRKENNISQANLSYDIDIDISTLSRLERGVLNVSFNKLYKIAKHFKIEIKELFAD